MKALVMAAIVVGGAVAASNVHAQDRAALQRQGKTSDELERRDQPVTKEDLQILERASAILRQPPCGIGTIPGGHPSDKT
jgi:hypothetical protein